MIRQFLRRLVILSGFCLILATPLSGQTRGFYFQIGLGVANAEYPSELNTMMNALANEPGINRATIDLNLGLGFAVTENLYVTGLITGVGDRVADNIDHIQLNTYVYGVGVQGYPFGTGLQLGAHVGPSRLGIQTSMFGDDMSPWGLGTTFSAAWDFARGLTGPSALLGVRAGGASIEDESIGFASLFLSFVYK